MWFNNFVGLAGTRKENEMTTYYVIGERYINSNTPEHGFGDYPERKSFITLKVEAETKRKAQNKAKKIDARIVFGGMFGNQILEEHEVKERTYIDRNGVDI
tara:strand:+ start:1007 stop:1309 length:303 start_codon:yes stop_codon:yes gene_type:complete